MMNRLFVWFSVFTAEFEHSSRTQEGVSHVRMLRSPISFPWESPWLSTREGSGQRKLSRGLLVTSSQIRKGFQPQHPRMTVKRSRPLLLSPWASTDLLSRSLDGSLRGISGSLVVSTDIMINPMRCRYNSGHTSIKAIGAGAQAKYLIHIRPS